MLDNLEFSLILSAGHKIVISNMHSRFPNLHSSGSFNEFFPHIKSECKKILFIGKLLH